MLKAKFTPFPTHLVQRRESPYVFPCNHFQRSFSQQFFQKKNCLSSPHPLHLCKQLILRLFIMKLLRPAAAGSERASERDIHGEEESCRICIPAFPLYLPFRFPKKDTGRVYDSVQGHNDREQGELLRCNYNVLVQGAVVRTRLKISTVLGGYPKKTTTTTIGWFHDLSGSPRVKNNFFLCVCC